MASDSLRTGLRIGEFEIAALFPEGTGGMSTVVRARALSPSSGLPGTVALKISRLGAAETFYTNAIKFESDLLSRLNHAGVVRILPIARIKEGQLAYAASARELPNHPWYFVMECLLGGSLQAYIRRRGKLPLGEAAHLGRQIGHTLDYIHAAGYVHNDIKPENILFRQAPAMGRVPEPVLIDFGIAAKNRRLREDGTLQYMAPERLEKAGGSLPPERMVDPTKADVWAMGVLMYRLLSGREPFSARTKQSLSTAIRHQPAETLTAVQPQVPQELDMFITEGCLAKQPQLRPTMAEFGQVVSRYASDGKITQSGLGGLSWPW